jgi:hypothetical protein
MPVEEETEEVVEGWEGKPKGMLQILWERGFIDPAKKKEDCTIDGKKDALGNVDPETSLKRLMSLLTDFIQEETLLQHHGRLLGVKVERTPKCHPEIAGEGIEHDWGCAKGVNRRLPMSEKRTKKKFGESVQKAMDSTEALTIDKMRRLFSKRARECMLAHDILDNEKMGSLESADVDDDKKPDMTAHLTEKIVKQHKSHRSAADFDAGFINRIVDKIREQQHANSSE